MILLGIIVLLAVFFAVILIPILFHRGDTNYIKPLEEESEERERAYHPR